MHSTAPGHSAGAPFILRGDLVERTQGTEGEQSSLPVGLHCYLAAAFLWGLPDPSYLTGWLLIPCAVLTPVCDSRGPPLRAGSRWIWGAQG